MAINILFIFRFSSKSNGKSQFRESLSQIIAVTIKNMVLLSYSVALGFPTVLIAGITKNDPNEKLHLDMEDVSWISEYNSHTDKNRMFSFITYPCDQSE